MTEIVPWNLLDFLGNQNVGCIALKSSNNTKEKRVTAIVPLITLKINN